MQLTIKVNYFLSRTHYSLSGIISKDETLVSVPRFLNVEQFYEGIDCTEYVFSSAVVHQGALPSEGHVLFAQRHGTELVVYDDTRVSAEYVLKIGTHENVCVSGKKG